MHIAGRSIRVILGAAVLFGNTPAWRHAHAAGDRPHDHDHLEHIQQAHGHHSHGPHDHARRNSSGHHHDQITVKHRAHVHLAVFGVGVTLPLEDDDSEQGQPTILVAAPATVELGQSHWDFIYFAPSPRMVGESLPDAPKLRCKTAIAARLSDNARHERSGVQLS